MRYDTIIFDCDGTLVNSELAYNHAAIDLFVDYGLPRYTIEYALKDWMGNSFDNIIRMEAQKNNVALPIPELIEKMISMVPAYQEKYIKDIDGALPAVRALSATHKCCVASNGEMPNIISSLALTNFTEVFPVERIFSKDQVERAKPFPDLFLFACEKMNAEVSRTIVVEDSVFGVRAGVAAGLYVIAFNGVEHAGAQNSDALLTAGARVVLDDWNDILHHIHNLG